MLTSLLEFNTSKLEGHHELQSDSSSQKIHCCSYKDQMDNVIHGYPS